MNCKQIWSHILDHILSQQMAPVLTAIGDEFMAISLNYRGDLKSKEAEATIVEWSPTEFKASLNERQSAVLKAVRSIALIGINARVFTNGVAKKYVIHILKEHVFILLMIRSMMIMMIIHNVNPNICAFFFLFSFCCQLLLTIS